MNIIEQERLEKYFAITREALQAAKEAPENLDADGARDDFLDMITRYIHDAQHFQSKDDIVNAFAALNYAHGWLDAGARIGLWDVTDNRLFTVDDEKKERDSEKS